MLEFSVKAQELSRLDHFKPAAKSVGYLKAKVTFATDEWSGGTVKLRAQNESDAIVHEAEIVNGVALVPWEALDVGGSFFVSIFKDDGDIEITTNMVSIELKDTLDSGMDTNPPTPTEFDTLKKDVAGLKEQLDGVDTSELATKGEIPANVSELTNDAGYVTDEDVAPFVVTLVEPDDDESLLYVTCTTREIIEAMEHGRTVYLSSSSDLSILLPVSGAVEIDGELLVGVSMGILAEGIIQLIICPDSTVQPLIVEWATTDDIPENLSDLHNDRGFITDAEADARYASVDAIPTNVSDLVNDAGYMTEEHFTEIWEPIVVTISQNESGGWESDASLLEILMSQVYSSRTVMLNVEWGDGEYTSSNVNWYSSGDDLFMTVVVDVIEGQILCAMDLNGVDVMIVPSTFVISPVNTTEVADLEVGGHFDVDSGFEELMTAFWLGKPIYLNINDCTIPLTGYDDADYVFSFVHEFNGEVHTYTISLDEDEVLVGTLQSVDIYHKPLVITVESVGEDDNGDAVFTHDGNFEEIATALEMGRPVWLSLGGDRIPIMGCDESVALFTISAEGVTIAFLIDDESYGHIEYDSPEKLIEEKIDKHAEDTAPLIVTATTEDFESLELSCGYAEIRTAYDAGRDVWLVIVVEGYTEAVPLNLVTSEEVGFRIMTEDGLAAVWVYPDGTVALKHTEFYNDSNSRLIVNIVEVDEESMTFKLDCSVDDIIIASEAGKSVWLDVFGECVPLTLVDSESNLAIFNVLIDGMNTQIEVRPDDVHIAWFDCSGGDIEPHIVETLAEDELGLTFHVSDTSSAIRDVVFSGRTVLLDIDGILLPLSCIAYDYEEDYTSTDSVSAMFSLAIEGSVISFIVDNDGKGSVFFEPFKSIEVEVYQPNSAIDEYLCYQSSMEMYEDHATFGDIFALIDNGIKHEAIRYTDMLVEFVAVCNGQVSVWLVDDEAKATHLTYPLSEPLVVHAGEINLEGFTVELDCDAQTIYNAVSNGRQVLLYADDGYLSLEHVAGQPDDDYYEATFSRSDNYLTAYVEVYNDGTTGYIRYYCNTPSSVHIYTQSDGNGYYCHTTVPELYMYYQLTGDIAVAVFDDVRHPMTYCDSSRAEFAAVYDGQASVFVITDGEGDSAIVERHVYALHEPNELRLQSPNGSVFKITVSDDGTLNAEAVQE